MKAIFTIFFFCVGTSMFAQELQLSYDHTALVVADLQKSEEFYKNILQLEEIEIPYENPVLKWFSLGGPYQLHLIQMESAKEYQPNKAVHFALKLKSLDSLILQLNKNNVPYWDWNGTKSQIAIRPDGLRQIYVQDPDRHWIEINEQVE